LPFLENRQKRGIFKKYIKIGNVEKGKRLKNSEIIASRVKPV